MRSTEEKYIYIYIYIYVLGNKVNRNLLNTLLQAKLFHCAVFQNSRPPQQPAPLMLTSTNTDKRLIVSRQLFACVICFESRDGVVSIVTVLRAGRSGIRISAQTSNFSPVSPHRLWSPTRSYLMRKGGYFPGVTRPGHKSDYSRPPSDVVKNE